ncbi:uncharacterized protein BcabD6B2_27980 [Babesia caballi]|uniref:Uncharacterized protein n=1 Tax=Babesia caballi TaxID=5871 RepID=A0AAV4LUD6_BABCB|nr:hypothetical protein BcabD6B2_27980 [Babesia caballi]
MLVGPASRLVLEEYVDLLIRHTGEALGREVDQVRRFPLLQLAPQQAHAQTQLIVQLDGSRVDNLGPLVLRGKHRRHVFELLEELQQAQVDLHREPADVHADVQGGQLVGHVLVGHLQRDHRRLQHSVVVVQTRVVRGDIKHHRRVNQRPFLAERRRVRQVEEQLLQVEGQDHFVFDGEEYTLAVIQRQGGAQLPVVVVPYELVDAAEHLVNNVAPLLPGPLRQAVGLLRVGRHVVNAPLHARRVEHWQLILGRNVLDVLDKVIRLQHLHLRRLLSLCGAALRGAVLQRTHHDADAIDLDFGPRVLQRDLHVDHIAKLRQAHCHLVGRIAKGSVVQATHARHRTPAPVQVLDDVFAERVAQAYVLDAQLGRVGHIEIERLLEVLHEPRRPNSRARGDVPRDVSPIVEPGRLVFGVLHHVHEVEGGTPRELLEIPHVVVEQFDDLEGHILLQHQRGLRTHVDEDPRRVVYAENVKGRSRAPRPLFVRRQVLHYAWQQGRRDGHAAVDAHVVGAGQIHLLHAEVHLQNLGRVFLLLRRLLAVRQLPALREKIHQAAHRLPVRKRLQRNQLHLPDGHDGTLADQRRYGYLHRTPLPLSHGLNRERLKHRLHAALAQVRVYRVRRLYQPIPHPLLVQQRRQPGRLRVPRAEQGHQNHRLRVVTGRQRGRGHMVEPVLVHQQPQVLGGGLRVAELVGELASVRNGRKPPHGGVGQRHRKIDHFGALAEVLVGVRRRGGQRLRLPVLFHLELHVQQCDGKHPLRNPVREGRVETRHLDGQVLDGGRLFQANHRVHVYHRANPRVVDRGVVHHDVPGEVLFAVWRRAGRWQLELLHHLDDGLHEAHVDGVVHVSHLQIDALALSALVIKHYLPILHLFQRGVHVLPQVARPARQYDPARALAVHCGSRVPNVQSHPLPSLEFDPRLADPQLVQPRFGRDLNLQPVNAQQHEPRAVLDAAQLLVQRPHELRVTPLQPVGRPLVEVAAEHLAYVGAAGEGHGPSDVPLVELDQFLGRPLDQQQAVQPHQLRRLPALVHAAERHALQRAGRQCGHRLPVDPNAAHFNRERVQLLQPLDVLPRQLDAVGVAVPPAQLRQVRHQRRPDPEARMLPRGQQVRRRAATGARRAHFRNELFLAVHVLLHARSPALGALTPRRRLGALERERVLNVLAVLPAVQRPVVHEEPIAHRLLGVRVALLVPPLLVGPHRLLQLRLPSHERADHNPCHLRPDHRAAGHGLHALGQHRDDVGVPPPAPLVALHEIFKGEEPHGPEVLTDERIQPH